MKKLIMFALTALPLISGCSDQPKQSALNDAVTSFWSKCPEVTVKDIKKTNGIRKGLTYDIAYTFNIKFNESPTFGFCPNGMDKVTKRNMQAYTFGKIVVNKLGITDLREIKKDSEITVNAVAEFVKTDNGWVYNRDITP